MASQPQAHVEPRILRIFVSYASEDLLIAKAVASALRDALPVGHTDICFDKWFLEAGSQFKRQIEEKLERTDVFIIVYTGVNKLFTGWELGFFEAVRRHDPTRRIVPLYLEQLPSTAEEYEGRSLKISKDLLKLSVEDFTRTNVVALDDPMCTLIEDLQEQVERIKEEGHFPRIPPHERPNPVDCVKNMRLGIFGYLKTTVRQITKPQKEITIKTTGTALKNTDGGLPNDAVMTPVSGNPMSIFGLADAEMTWEQFVGAIGGAHQDSWREAIRSVITSSQADRIDVDNNQLILSNDESKVYRIILTTATRRWNDSQEFNLYFVETYREEEYGDEDTTLLLKGLETTCRYRFMFLESRSEFSANKILAAQEELLPDMALELLRELNLMRTQAIRAGLNDSSFWSEFVGWPLILDIGTVYRAKEKTIRELIGQIVGSKKSRDELIALRERLSGAIGELEESTRKPNAGLIEAMSKKLQDLVHMAVPEG